jgi:hypothetical protein
MCIHIITVITLMKRFHNWASAWPYVCGTFICLWITNTSEVQIFMWNTRNTRIPQWEHGDNITYSAEVKCENHLRFWQHFWNLTHSLLFYCLCFVWSLCICRLIRSILQVEKSPHTIINTRLKCKLWWHMLAVPVLLRTKTIKRFDFVAWKQNLQDSWFSWRLKVK